MVGANAPWISALAMTSAYVTELWPRLTALAYHRKVGTRTMEGYALGLLGRLSHHEGRSEKARREVAEAEAIMREVVAIAGAAGRTIRPSFVDTMLADTAKMAPYKPSMLLDFERRQPLELEAIYRRPLAVAAAAGLACPAIESLYGQLSRLAESEGSMSLRP